MDFLEVVLPQQHSEVTAWNGEYECEWMWNDIDVEYLEQLSSNPLGEAEKTHETPQSELSLNRSTFQPVSFRMQI